MPDADVIYSDVKFTTGRRSRSAETTSSSAQTTYYEVKIPQTDPTTEPEAHGSQRPAKRRGTLTSERAALLVLSLLLAAAVTALSLTYYQHIQTKTELEKLQSNLTTLVKASCYEPKQCEPLQPTCPDPTSKICWTCEQGWEHHGGKCYFFSSNLLSWSQSKAKCREMGGDLVVINSKEEQEFLVWTLMPKMMDLEDKFWIGLTDIEIEGKWMWVDGSPLNTSWNFWLGSNPDNWEAEDPNGEDCVRMGEKEGAADLKCWLDKSCKVPHKSICEKQERNGFYTCT